MTKNEPAGGDGRVPSAPPCPQCQQAMTWSADAPIAGASCSWRCFSFYCASGPASIPEALPPPRDETRICQRCGLPDSYDSHYSCETQAEALPPLRRISANESEHGGLVVHLAADVAAREQAREAREAKLLSTLSQDAACEAELREELREAEAREAVLRQQLVEFILGKALTRLHDICGAEDTRG